MIEHRNLGNNTKRALQFTDSWPIPQRGSAYGLFDPYDPHTEEYFASSILNVTNNLRVLDEATPIASRTLYNLLELSAIASVSTFTLSITVILIYDRARGWKEKIRCRLKQQFGIVHLVCGRSLHGLLAPFAST